MPTRLAPRAANSDARSRKWQASLVQPGRHRRGVEEQHDRAVGEQLCEASHGARLVRQFELGNLVTTFHEGHATPDLMPVPWYRSGRITRCMHTPGRFALPPKRGDPPAPDRRQPRHHHLTRGLPGAGRRTPRGAGDPQGARRQRDPTVGVPQAGRQPARDVLAGVGRERPVVVAMVVHRRGRPVGADDP